MTDLQMWSLIVGTLLPPAIAIIQQPKWNNGLRSVVAVLLCAIAGGVTVYLEGELTGRRFFSAFLVIVVATLATYQGFWKPVGAAPSIEASTSPS